MGGCRCNINFTRSSSAASAVAFIVSSDRYNIYCVWSLTKAGTVLFGVTGEDISLEIECATHICKSYCNCLGTIAKKED